MTHGEESANRGGGRLRGRQSVDPQPGGSAASSAISFAHHDAHERGLARAVEARGPRAVRGGDAEVDLFEEDGRADVLGRASRAEDGFGVRTGVGGPWRRKVVEVAPEAERQARFALEVGE